MNLLTNVDYAVTIFRENDLLLWLFFLNQLDLKFSCLWDYIAFPLSFRRRSFAQECVFFLCWVCVFAHMLASPSAYQVSSSLHSGHDPQTARRLKRNTGAAVGVGLHCLLYPSESRRRCESLPLKCPLLCSRLPALTGEPSTVQVQVILQAWLDVNCTPLQDKHR